MNENNTQKEVVDANENLIDSETSQVQSTKSFNGFLSNVLEVIKTVIICLAIILPIRYFLFQPFLVDGASMQPNFHNRDYLIVNEISYRFNNPKRGEVIVFKNPDNLKQYYIKRVIATPGESIKFEDGNVYIKKVGSNDFEKLSETDYLPADFKTIAGDSELTLGQDEYFVMGDNRSNSRDSRVFGPLKRELITGRVWLRGLPVGQATIFDFEDYKFF